jgi:nucleoside-diphosphate-sugar epimerase
VTLLVTGSSGHLGEALVRTLKAQRREAAGIDNRAGAFTHRVGTITDRDFVRHCMKGVDTVLHTAALHKPHVLTHSRRDFVDVNITGTLNLLELRSRAPEVVRRYVPEFEGEYARRGWKMIPGIDRVYVNDRARAELGWQPRDDFRALIARLKADEDIRSPLAREVGSKGYHDRLFGDGPYPVE